MRKCQKYIASESLNQCDMNKLLKSLFINMNYFVRLETGLFCQEAILLKIYLRTVVRHLGVFSCPFSLSLILRCTSNSGSVPDCFQSKIQYFSFPRNSTILQNLIISGSRRVHRKAGLK